jgi:type VI secretion system protein ImpL
MLTTLLSILTNRILWSFLGVTALAAVIWMIGPLLSIVDTRPLESEQNRVISIAVVYLIWAQSHILPRLYNAWLNRKLMDRLNENTAHQEAADPQKRLNSEEQILAGRFDEAAQMLKKRTSAKQGMAHNGRSASARSICTSCPGM